MKSLSLVSALTALLISTPAVAQHQHEAKAPKVQEAKILVTEKGYEPALLKLKKGQPVKLTVIRTTNNTCGTEIVFKTLGIQKVLPLNQAVTIELTPKQIGAAKTLTFMCGMDMLTGEIVLE